MKRAHATLDPKKKTSAVLVTGSIAEMIGGGVTPEGTRIVRFLPRTIDEDQWAERRPRHALAVEGIRRKRSGLRSRSRGPRAPPPPRQHQSVRSTAPSTCPPTLPRSGVWSKASAARSNLVFPLGADLSEVPKLAEADINICLYPRVRPQALRGAGQAPIFRRRSGCIRRNRLLAQS